jgi:hypothetical protein
VSYSHKSVRKIESESCVGAAIYLYKMTEGRRLDLRESIAKPNRETRELIRKQEALGKMAEGDAVSDNFDYAAWLELQDEIDYIRMSELDPALILWGVKKVEGLEVDGESLDVKDWKRWPSNFYKEVAAAVQAESELNAAEKKESLLPTTSSVADPAPPPPSTATNVSEGDTGEKEIASAFSRSM